MRAFKRFLIVVPLASAVLTWTLGRAVANGGFHGESGKAIEGLTLDQMRLFRDGRDEFQATEDAGDGLGPIFNDNSCVACHFAPAIGGASPILETRAAKITGNTYFELPGGSLFQSTAIDPGCAEVIPSDANVIAKRQTQPLFGLGLVEAIPDEQIEAYAAEEAATHPAQAGRVNKVTDPETGRLRVGRFGWKNQQATLLAFAGDAYVNEMGITSRFFPTENAPNGDVGKLANCDHVQDPEDGDNDIDKFANFMRLLAPPPRDSDWDRWWVQGRFSSRGGHRFPHRGPDRDHGRFAAFRNGRGREVFERIGCDVCHHTGFVAESPIDAIDGLHVDAFSDYLLHDVGTGDGIIQGNAQGNEFRTPPLWGISESAPYLHDGSARSIRDAVDRHTNQGAAARDAFQHLSYPELRALLDFLDSI